MMQTSPQAMKLSDHDLRQIDEERINKLSETAVKSLLITLLNDPKDARERQNQNSKNSSIPPGSEAPWDKASKYEDEKRVPSLQMILRS